MDGGDGIATPNANVSGQHAAIVAEESPRRMSVHELLGGQRELILMLQEIEYRLRITSNGKLILTK